MRFNAATDYAIRCMVYLAKCGRQRSTAAIADAIGAPREFMLQIAVALRNTSLLNAQCGRFGGFELSRNPAEISIHDISDAMGEGFSVSTRASLAEAREARLAALVDEQYERVFSDFEDRCKRTTLADIVRGS